MRLEGNGSSLLNKEISFQWSQNFDLCGTVIVAEYQSSIDTTNISINKTPNLFDASLADSGWLWVPSEPTIGIVQLGIAATAEGYNNKAVQIASHAEGYKCIAAGKYSHAEGKNTVAVYAAHSEGMDNRSIGICSHTEGSQNLATRSNTHAEGTYTKALFDNAHAEGSNTQAGQLESGNSAHAEGKNT